MVISSVPVGGTLLHSSFLQTVQKGSSWHSVWLK